MNTKIKFTRFVFALVFALSALAVTASAAQAGPPTKSENSFSLDGSLVGACSFPVNVQASITNTEIDFFDSSGTLVRSFQHTVEQDTFTTNGKTLVGIPFTFNMEWLFDSDGNLIHIYVAGVTETVPLPDGSVFRSAGRADLTNHPGTDFVISPDKGNPGNVDGFCAALAP